VIALLGTGVRLASESVFDLAGIRTIATEARAVPPDDGLGRDEDEDVGPPRPPPAQDDPEPAVGAGDARAPAAQGEGGQLLAEGKDLKHEVGAVAEDGDEGAEKQQRDLEHSRMRIDGGGGNVNDRREYDLWRGTAQGINAEVLTTP